MRHLFSTKVILILVVAAILAAGLAVLSGLDQQTPLGTAMQFVMTPIRSVGTTLTRLLKNTFMFPIESVVMTLFLGLMLPITDGGCRKRRSGDDSASVCRSGQAL